MADRKIEVRTFPITKIDVLEGGEVWLKQMIQELIQGIQIKKNITLKNVVLISYPPPLQSPDPQGGGRPNTRKNLPFWKQKLQKQQHFCLCAVEYEGSMHGVELKKPRALLCSAIFDGEKNEGKQRFKLSFRSTQTYQVKVQDDTTQNIVLKSDTGNTDYQILASDIDGEDKTKMIEVGIDIQYGEGEGFQYSDTLPLNLQPKPIRLTHIAPTRLLRPQKPRGGGGGVDLRRLKLQILQYERDQGGKRHIQQRRMFNARLRAQRSRAP